MGASEKVGGQQQHFKQLPRKHRKLHGIPFRVRGVVKTLEQRLTDQSGTEG